jgi:hypothetical protein
VQNRWEGPGELNFAITSVCLDYAAEFEPANYQVFNDIIGALEAAKLEFYRRMVVPYEQHKAELNGDVYPQDLGPGR